MHCFPRLLRKVKSQSKQCACHKSATYPSEPSPLHHARMHFIVYHTWSIFIQGATSPVDSLCPCKQGTCHTQNTGFADSQGLASTTDRMLGLAFWPRLRHLRATDQPLTPLPQKDITQPSLVLACFPMLVLAIDFQTRLTPPKLIAEL